MASEQGENRGKKNQKEQEWKILNKLLTWIAYLCRQKNK
jgi:hypothetical protein